jgi:hypothetical protein
MKTLVATLLLVSAYALSADQPDDGFYRRAQGEPAPWTMSQDGQKLFLGSKQDLKILKSEISSQSNSNDLFHLYLTVPYDENLDPGSYVLMVAGTAYRQTGSGSSPKETSSLSFYISKEENAKQVSRYMKTAIVYRRHPRHNLRTVFIPTKREFEVGEEVTATLQIKNVGTNSVSFMKGGRNRAARDNQYVFSAWYNGKQVEDIGTNVHFGGMALRRVLKPGEVFEDVISLSKWFSFNKAGMYEIHGSYYLDFNDPDADTWRTLWEDYVSADFLLTIKKP